MTYTYTPQGVCSRQMSIQLENGIIQEVEISGGCNGNLQGLSVLLCGMDATAAIARLQGIDCGGKGTSCPDQLARGLTLALQAAK